jgi:hypothetical protein
VRVLVAVLIVAGLVVLIRFWRRLRFRALLRQLDARAASDLEGFAERIRERRGPSPELLGELIERYYAESRIMRSCRAGLCSSFLSHSA